MLLFLSLCVPFYAVGNTGLDTGFTYRSNSTDRKTTVNHGGKLDGSEAALPEKMSGFKAAGVKNSYYR